MILELENGSLKVYNIDREKNEYKDLWFMAINKFKPMEGGEVLTPVELGLKEEEKIIEEGEKDDIGEQK